MLGFIYLVDVIHKYWIFHSCLDNRCCLVYHVHVFKTPLANNEGDMKLTHKYLIWGASLRPPFCQDENYA